MKATELMLGDWVLETEFGRNKQDQIERLGHVWVLLKNGLFTPINYIEPIPLTHEILRKNFTEEVFEGMIFYCHNTEFEDVTITEFSDGLWEVKVDEIEFADLPTWKMYVTKVHELQQALRLCEINKEITI